MNIFVAKLNQGTTSESLQFLFEQFGEVTSSKVIIDRETGESKGFAFVEMADDDQAQQAIENLNGALFEGSTIAVTEARPKEDRGGDRSGRFNNGSRDRNFNSQRPNNRFGGSAPREERYNNATREERLSFTPRSARSVDDTPQEDRFSSSSREDFFGGSSREDRFGGGHRGGNNRFSGHRDSKRGEGRGEGRFSRDRFSKDKRSRSFDDDEY